MCGYHLVMLKTNVPTYYKNIYILQMYTNLMSGEISGNTSLEGYHLKAVNAAK